MFVSYLSTQSGVVREVPVTFVPCLSSLDWAPTSRAVSRKNLGLTTTDVHTHFQARKQVKPIVVKGKVARFVAASARDVTSVHSLGMLERHDHRVFYGISPNI